MRREEKTNRKDAKDAKEEGEIEEAINELSTIKDDAEAWYNRGLVLANLGEYQQAIAPSILQ